MLLVRWKSSSSMMTMPLWEGESLAGVGEGGRIGAGRHPGEKEEEEEEEEAVGAEEQEEEGGREGVRRRRRSERRSRRR